jgi:hypothetical protein
MATLYFDIAICALGFQGEDARNWDTLQKAIHGSVKVEGASRTNYTGLKHLAPNRIRLRNQAAYLDQAPCVLIVPVLDLKRVKCWHGEPYKALVMVGEWPKRPDRSEDGQHKKLKDICSGIRMFDEGATAKPKEIEMARKLLEDVVKGMAYSLHNRVQRFLGDKLQETMNELKKLWANPFGAGVLVPDVKSDKPNLRVRIVQFSRAFWEAAAASGGDDANDEAAAEPGAKKARTDVEANTDGDGKVEGKQSTDSSDATAADLGAKMPGRSEREPKKRSTSAEEPTLNEDAKRNDDADADTDTGKGHPAPDPLLLAVRAAVNWSWRNNQKLLASGEPEEEDELDVLALEEFLEWQREELRPKTWEDLARGLHQLHGYQEELVP